MKGLSSRLDRVVACARSFRLPGPRGDLRRFVGGVFWLLRTGAPWRALPRNFGHWNSVFRRFRRWVGSGRWAAVQRCLRRRDDEDDIVLVDSTVVHAHPDAGGAHHSPAERALWQHVGASRFAFNECRRLHLDALRVLRAFTLGLSEDERKALPKEGWPPVPWSGFDFIKAFTAWKNSPAAAGPEGGRALPWKDAVHQNVFEEACVDFGRAMEARSAWNRGQRRGAKPGFPRWKKKHRSRSSFRVRKGVGKTSFADGVRTVRLPGKVGGTFTVREPTRQLRRLLRKSETALRFVTVVHEGGRWTLTVNLQTLPLHRSTRASEGPVVGVDRGLRTFAVLADSAGQLLAEVRHPRPLKHRLRRLQRLSRACSRKARGSRNRHRARRRLAAGHAHIRHRRHHFLRELVSELAQNHRHFVIETLSTKGLMKTSLSRALADSGWALFERWLTTKVGWHAGTVTKAPRNFPSTRRCSHCGEVGPKLPLAQRTFSCGRCGFVADRDHNAAINLARYPGELPQAALVPPKPGEAAPTPG